MLGELDFKDSMIIKWITKRILVPINMLFSYFFKGILIMKVLYY